MGGTGRAKRRKRIEQHGTGLEDANAGKPTGVGKRDRARRRRLAHEAEISNKPKESDFALDTFLKPKHKAKGEKKAKVEKRKSPASEFFSSEEEEAVVSKPRNGRNGKSVNKLPKQLFDESEEESGSEDDSNADESASDASGSGAEQSSKEQEDSDSDAEAANGKPDGLEDGLLRRKKSRNAKYDDDSDVSMEDDEEDSGAESGEDDSGSDADSDSSVDPLEEESRKIEKAKKQVEEDAAAELEDEVARNEEGEEFRLDQGALGRGGLGETADGTEIFGSTREELKTRLKGILHVLADLKNRKEEGKSRSDYIDSFVATICECYGYNDELALRLMDVFPKGELVDFMEASESPRPLTLRTNTLKTRRGELAQILIARGMNVDPIDKWSKVGLVVYDSQVPVGATPEYLAGHYMIQSASSFLPCVALAPQIDEKVLDLAAAPGGKSSYLAALMKNSGLLVANDLKKERIKSLVANLHRLGAKNTVVTNYDGREVPGVFGTMFDRALLDAPCSGTGIISHDASIKMNRTAKDIKHTTKIQKELLLAAIDSVNANSKTGGYVVYSTCSVLVEENEAVVDHALKNRHVKVMESGVPFGLPGFPRMRQHRFHPSVERARRVHPHVHNLDGFFVCKLRKLSNGVPGAEKAEGAEVEKGKKKKEKSKAEVKQQKDAPVEKEADGAEKGGDTDVKAVVKKRKTKAKAKQQKNSSRVEKEDKDAASAETEGKVVKKRKTKKSGLDKPDGDGKSPDAAAEDVANGTPSKKSKKRKLASGNSKDANGTESAESPGKTDVDRMEDAVSAAHVARKDKVRKRKEAMKRRLGMK